jgi:hypothetical protein
MCGMWALWTLRNKRRHEEQVMSLYQAVIWARDTTFDLWNLIKPAAAQSGTRAEPRWKPPDHGVLKINTDAAFNPSTGNGATACVIRDHVGGFCDGASKMVR